MLEQCLQSKTPVIVVSVSGRPYALESVSGRAAAIVQAFMPGEEGGTAIAEVITGVTNPSGRLPVEIPSTPTGQPSTYLHPRYGQPGLGMSPVDSIPLFTFGHGLSYTSFEYSAFALSTTEIATDGKFEASVTIKNVGNRAGSEVVQLYFTDPVAQVARPIIQLLGFEKIHLAAGESKKVTFHVHSDRLAYHGADVIRIVDPGVMKIHVGASSTDLKDTKLLTITGSIREVTAQRKLITEVTVA
jgi:beta-glucosidase